MPAEPPVRSAIGKPTPPASKPGCKLLAKAKAAPVPIVLEKPKVKVKLSRPVVDLIKKMNASGELESELRLGAVAVQLAEISQDEALEVLEAAMMFPTGRRDPISFVKEAAKELAAQAEDEKFNKSQFEMHANETNMLQDLVEDKIDDWMDNGPEQKLLAKGCPMLSDDVSALVFELCSKGLLPESTDSDRLGAFLVFLGEGPALEVLHDLNADSSPLGKDSQEFIIKAAKPILIAERGSQFAIRVSKRLRWMNINLGLLSLLEVSEAAFELAWLGEAAAMQVLKRMVKGSSTGHLFAEPTAWIRSAARRLTGDEVAAPPKEEEEKEGDEKTTTTGEKRKKPEPIFDDTW